MTQVSPYEDEGPTPFGGADASYDPSRFPPFAVTVDLVVFTVLDGELAVLVIERGEGPGEGTLALPGGFVRIDEDLDEAARRELVEETGLEIDPSALHQFRAYGAPRRDPRMRVVTIGYVALVPPFTALLAGGDARRALLAPVSEFIDDLPTGTGDVGDTTSIGSSGAGAHRPLAFDHSMILSDALEYVRTMIEETPAALDLCEEPFTMTALRKVYEAVWNCELDRTAFHKRVRAIDGFIELYGEETAEETDGLRLQSPVILDDPALDPALDSMPSPSELSSPRPSRRLSKRGRGRPARRYVRGERDTLHPPLRRPRTYTSNPESKSVFRSRPSSGF